MSFVEKSMLTAAFSRLSPDEIAKALEIFAQNNPNIQAAAEDVSIHMEAQSESTLWKLRFFVNRALEDKVKGSAAKVGNDNNKRKQDICDALATAKTAKKKRKLAS